MLSLLILYKNKREDFLLTSQRSRQIVGREFFVEFWSGVWKCRETYWTERFSGKCRDQIGLECLLYVLKPATFMTLFCCMLYSFNPLYKKFQFLGKVKVVYI